MKKFIIAILSLTFIFTACSKDEGDLDLSSVEKIELSKKDKGLKTIDDLDDGENEGKEKKEKNDKKKVEKKDSGETINLFAELAGKEFMTYPASGSDRIYFHKDGNVDGASYYGNGNMASTNLYKAKFDFVEKVDDKTYKVKLANFDYQSPVDKTEKLDYHGFEFIHNYIRPLYLDDKMVGDVYTIRLPKTKLESFSQNDQDFLKTYNDDYIKNGNINIFTISKKTPDSNKESVIMTEVVGDNIKAAKKDDKNYLRDFEEGWKEVYDDLAKTQNSAGNSSKNDAKVEPNPNYNENLDYGLLADIFLESYNNDKSGKSDVIDFNKSIDFVKKNSAAFVHMEDGNKFIDKFQDPGISGLNLDSNANQPIIKILGEFVDEKELRPDNGQFHAYDNILKATLNSGESIIIKLKFCGDLRNATYDGIVKVWALPLGVYTNDDGVRVFEFVSGEGIQHAAYKNFGESYGF